MSFVDFPAWRELELMSKTCWQPTGEEEGGQEGEGGDGGDHGGTGESGVRSPPGRPELPPPLLSRSGGCGASVLWAAASVRRSRHSPPARGQV